jgi:hypothetical protein
MCAGSGDLSFLRDISIVYISFFPAGGEEEKELFYVGYGDTHMPPKKKKKSQDKTSPRRFDRRKGPRARINIKDPGLATEIVVRQEPDQQRASVTA